MKHEVLQLLKIKAGKKKSVLIYQQTAVAYK